MSIILEEKTCPICGIHYAVDQEVMNYKRNAAATDKNRGWYCPNGHSLVFRQSAADTYRQERDIARQQLARVEDEKRAAWATATAQIERAKKAEAKAARLHKRATGGVCPCCSRTFSNVQRHMRSKHPDVVPLKKIAKVRA